MCTGRSYDSGDRHRQQEWFEPILHVAYEKVVDEYSGKSRNYQTRYYKSETGQEDIAKSEMTSPQATAECANQRRIVPASPKLWGLLEGQNHTGKGLVEFFRPDDSGTGGRIAQIIFIRFDPLDNEKVIEVPEDNKREREVTKFVRFAFETPAYEPVLTPHLQNVTGFHTIARHTARESKLFERYDPPEVSKNDFQCCSSTFHGFHLHHRRGFDTTPLECE
jgi:hypothetical protein